MAKNATTTESNFDTLESYFKKYPDVPKETILKQHMLSLGHWFSDAALEASAVKMARAFDTLTAERGSTTGITNPIVGTISLYQVGEWAASHVARHYQQAKRALA